MYIWKLDRLSASVVCLILWPALVLTAGCETKLKTRAIDDNVRAYEFSPSREVAYYLKREAVRANNIVALWAYDVKSATTRRIAELGDVKEWNDIRGPIMAVTTEGAVLIKHNARDILVFENEALKGDYRFFYKSDILPDKEPFKELSEDQRRRVADFYRERAAHNALITYVKGFSEFSQDTYYFVRGEYGSPILLEEPQGDVRGERFDILGRPFYELEPAKFKQWNLTENPNMEDVDRNSRTEDVPNQLTINRKERGDCGNMIGPFIFRRDCIVRYTITFRDKTHRFGENEFVILPTSRYLVVADGALVLRVNDKLLTAQ